MRILAVCQYYHPEPFRISDICESLVNRGHEVTVLTGLPNYPEGFVPTEYRYGRKRTETVKGVKVIRCFEIGRGKGRLRLFVNYISYTVSASVKAMLLSKEYDVIYVHQLSPVLMTVPAIVYKKRSARKILLYCLDLWPESLAAGGIREGSLIYKVFLWISRAIYNSADQILVTSGMFIKYFADVLLLDSKGIRHLPQYAEELYGECASDTRKTSSNYVFAGNIGDMQSVETIVQAANELRKRREIVFHLVGDGSKLEYCRQIAKDYKLENVKFYGRRPLSEMPYYYSMAKAMLVTLRDNKSLSYTLPGKIQSYMAAGKPIIGAINGEARKVIEEAKCGLCCTAEDYKGLARLIEEFEERDDAKQMADNALGYYQSNYSKESFVSSLETALKNLEG